MLRPHQANEKTDVFDFNVCAKVCARQIGRLGVARKLLNIWCPLVDSNY